MEDIDPYITEYASQHHNTIEFSAAFQLLRDRNAPLKVGFAKFKELAAQSASSKGYTIVSPTPALKTAFLLPRPSQTPRAPPPSQPDASRPTHEFDPTIPRYSFEDVGGLDPQKLELDRLIRLPIEKAHLFESVGINPSRSVLLHGPSGCGKTLLAEAAAGEFTTADSPPLSFYHISAVDLSPPQKSFSGQSENRLRALFDAAAHTAPSLILLDRLDAIAGRKHHILSAQLGQCLDRATTPPVFVIATTSHLDDIDGDLRTTTRFSRELAIGIPDFEQRLSTLRVCAARLSCAPDVELDAVAREAEGFVGGDIAALCREAALSAVARAVAERADAARVTHDDLLRAVGRVQPTMRREGFARLPPAAFDDIGGLAAVKAELQLAVVHAVLRPDVFRMYGHRPSSGVLLWGPPGCGKTLLARAIAHEANRAAFISIKGPELMNKWVGESESAVRAVFRRARDSAPCIIFFDEIDAICPRRSDESGSQAASRVVNQLLTEMDGVEDRGRVFVIGATNRPKLVDEAMLRPGRLDKIIEVPLPSAEERVDILEKLMRRIGHRSADIDCREIGGRCERASGAELEALVGEAIEGAIRESVDEQWVPVGQKHFENAIVKLHAARAIRSRQVA